MLYAVPIGHETVQCTRGIHLQGKSLDMSSLGVRPTQHGNNTACAKELAEARDFAHVVLLPCCVGRTPNLDMSNDLLPANGYRMAGTRLCIYV